jgi:hypothetical protein
MALRLVRFGVRSRLYLELLRASEGRLRCSSRLHLAEVSTHQPALDLRGGIWTFLLLCNPEGRPMPQQWGH